MEAKVGGTTKCNFNACRAAEIQSVCDWGWSRHTGRWPQLENPEITPLIYDQIFDKSVKNNSIEEGQFFNRLLK